MNDSKQTNKILILGGPDVGKTHFGGQLYGRLNKGTGDYKITSPPDNLSVFREVIDCLAEGKSASRTQVSTNEELELEVEDEDQHKTTIALPDYGGEQIDKIVKERRVNLVWNEYINKSTSWLLFIRLDRLKSIEDVVSRGIPDNEVMKEREEKKDPKSSPSAFFIELLQIFLHIKGKSKRAKLSNPNLIVVLSCWDNIQGIQDDTEPSILLKERLPMVKEFIDSNWHKDSRSVIGLSSTERTLLNDEVDEEYLDKGPTSFGYIQDENGTKRKDLTNIITKAIG